MSTTFSDQQFPARKTTDTLVISAGPVGHIVIDRMGNATSSGPIAAKLPAFPTAVVISVGDTTLSPNQDDKLLLLVSRFLKTYPVEAVSGSHGFDEKSWLQHHKQALRGVI